MKKLNLIALVLLAFMLTGCEGEEAYTTTGANSPITVIAQDAGDDIEAQSLDQFNTTAPPQPSEEGGEEENIIGCSDSSKLDPESDCFVE